MIYNIRRRLITESTPPPPPLIYLAESLLSQYFGYTAKAAVVLLLLCSFLFAAPAFAADITVDADCTLREAITVANGTAQTGCETSSDDADTITITAAGTADGTITLSADLPDISSIITINGGGYTIDADGSSATSRRSFKLQTGGELTVNNLTLTGGSHGSGGAIYATGGGSLTLSNVTMTNNESVTAHGGAIRATGGVNLTLSNVTMTNNSARSRGGGIYIEGGGSLTLSGGTLTHNTSFLDGGAIYATGGGSLTLNNVTMNNNESTHDSGGAIYATGGGSLTLSDATMTDNSADRDGGVIYIEGGGNLTLSNFTMNNNSAGEAGGAICVKGGSSLTLSDATLTHNSSVSTGGAIHIEGGGSLTLSDATLTHNSSGSSGGAIWADDDGDRTLSNASLTHNTASDYGGAIGVEGREIILDAVTLTDNTAGNTAGALWAIAGNLTVRDSIMSNNTALDGTGGAIHTNPGADMSISGSSFDNNSAGTAAIYIWQSDSVTIANSTITNNSGASGGGGISANNANITLSHVTLYNNSSADGAGGSFRAHSGGTAHIVNSIIYGGSNACNATLATDVGNLIGSGNCSATALTDDPMLGALTGSPAYFPLLPGSPAIDSASAADCLEFDQTGARRAGKGPNCDIGAYEYFVKPPMAAERSTPVPAKAAFSTCLASHSQLPASIVISGVTSPSAQCQHIGAGGVGQAAVLNRGFIDAVDVWSYLAGGLEVCFRHSGEIIFLDAATSPRSPSPVSAYSTTGLTCAWVDRPGTVVLVMGPAPPPKAAAAPVSVGLSGCMVTTTDILNFRGGPDGEVMGALPYDVTLTALARAADWFQVDYHGQVGWISAGYVTTDGSCG